MTTTDWAYRSESDLFLYKSVEFTAPPLLEGGLRVGYKWNNGKYEAAVFARNSTSHCRKIVTIFTLPRY